MPLIDVNQDKFQPASRSGRGRRSIELRKWYFKLVYLLVVTAIVETWVRVFPATGISTAVVAVVASVLSFGAFVLGARIFRGALDPPGRSRPWWRLTGSRKWAWVLSSGLSIALAANIGGLLTVLVRARYGSATSAALGNYFLEHHRAYRSDYLVHRFGRETHRADWHPGGEG